MYSEYEQQLYVMILRKSLYELKDAAHIWFGLVADKSEETILRYLNSAPCIFWKKNVLVVCYVDDLLVFTVKLPQIGHLKIGLEKFLSLINLGELKQFLETEIDWTQSSAVDLRQSNLIQNL